MSHKDLVIGIDIGGTKIKLVLMQGNDILTEDKYLVEDFKTPQKFLKALHHRVDELIKQYDRQDVVGIGVGVPAVLNKDRSRILVPPNLQLLKKIDLAQSLQQEFDLPVKVENDTNCMALGEMVYGAGKDKQSLVMLSLGTGVGGGIVYRQGEKINLWRGYHGAAGEIGHMIINFSGPEGKTGIKGELEQYASSKFMQRQSDKHPLDIQHQAEQGDEKALQIYQELGRYLGYGLANIVNIFDPQIIALGGGISNAYDLFIEQAEKTMYQNILTPAETNISIVQTQLKGRGGAMGATVLWTDYE